jgi:hypothetical protein
MAKFEAAFENAIMKKSSMIERRGVGYDVGTQMGGNWRPDYNPKVVHRELEIVRNDLHCNAISISARDIGRLMITAEDALGQGLEAWLSPWLWNRLPERTLSYITQAAEAAQLHKRYHGKVVLSVGSELTKEKLRNRRSRGSKETVGSWTLARR